MSQYNKTVLTRAGLELAKKANAGQAKFEITRAVTSAEDWSYKTTQDLEEVTNVPNIMQNGTIMDAEEVESNNAVIGVSLRFTNKDLTNAYQIRIIGLYVKEEGAKNEILYAVTTAVSPEYMPSFADKVLYRFNMQMYLVIGKAQAVNVVIDEGTAVTHGQLEKYKDEVTKSLDALAKTHKEDMGKTVKTASLNGGTKIAPDSNGNIDLTVPNPDLSKYVNIDDLNELLKGKADVTAIPNKAETENGIKEAKEMARNADNKAQNAMDSKANTSEVYSKSDIDTILSRSFFNKQGMNQQGNVVGVRANATKQADGGYAFNIWSNDWTASKLKDVMNQVNSLDTNKANKADVYDKSTVDQKVNDAKSSAKDIDLTQYAKNSDIYTKQIIDSAFSNRDQQITSANNNANSRLPLAGGTMALRSQIFWNGGYIDDRTGNLGGLSWQGGTDSAKIYGDQNGNDNLDLAVDLGDDGSNKLSIRNSGVEKASISANGVIKSPTTDDHENRIRRLEEKEFEVEVFTDKAAAAAWEAQRPGKRLAVFEK